MAKRKRPPLTIHVLTGGTGRTGLQAVTAALAQFSDPDVQVVTHPHVRTVTAARQIIQNAKQQRSIVCHTLVAPKIRAAVTREVEALSVPAVDVLGPLIQMLADRLNVAPRNQPGLSYELNREQFDRLDAVDFTIAHDDGQRIGELNRADVVLVGVSRVSKSVTCVVLASRGIRAANVPLIASLPPPPKLLELDPAKVFALTINAQRLQRLREARDRAWNQSLRGYADGPQVARELAYADSLAARQKWRTIDVSYKSVEEVASEIGGCLTANR